MDQLKKKRGKGVPVDIAAVAEQTLPEHIPTALSVTDLSEEDWVIAKKRYDIIRPILTKEKKVFEVVFETGIGKTNLYRWLDKYDKTGCVSSLANEKKSGGRGQSRLSAEVESIIQSVIETKYLNRQKLRPKKIYLDIALKCRAHGVDVPGYHTIWNRVNSIPMEIRLQRRFDPSIAKNKFKPLEGSFPGADYPLAVVQIDHTPVDIIVVDEVHRQPVGKPWITVAIDVYSRMVMGFYISLDPPGALGTGLCLSHAILPKEIWLSERNIEGQWPSHGLMRAIHMDNAREFHGRMLERACQEYGIEINFRPVATPNYGGHIERLMGTLMNEIHALPGTTFANTRERKYYDSEEKACFTIKELEVWLATYITGIYHNKLHKGIGTTPYAKYAEGIIGNKDQLGTGLAKPITNTLKLKLDFMPYVERSVQVYGVSVDAICYYHDVLRKWVHTYENPNAKYKSLKKFMFKRDPRDISAIYFYDPELKDYFCIPYRNTAHPSITIWEHKRILRDLKEKGQKAIDEDRLFEAYAQLQRLEAAAANSKAVARKLRNDTRKDESVKNSIKQAFTEEQQPTEPDTTFKYDPKVKYLPFDDLEHDPFNQNS